MKKLIFAVCYIFILAPIVSKGAVRNDPLVKVAVELKSKAASVEWIYDQKQKYSGAKENEDLAKIARLMTEKNFVSCSEGAGKSFHKHKDIQGWIANRALECLLMIQSWNGPALMSFRNWTKRIELNPELLTKGAWRESLLLNFVRGKLRSSKSDTNKKQAWKDIETVLASKDVLSKAERADLFFYIGNLAEELGQNEAATIYYQRSIELNSTKQALEKLSLNGDAVLNNNFSGEVKGEETELFTKMTNLFSKGEAIAGLEAGLTLLKQYPNGLKAALASEKILSYYLVMFDRADPKQSSTIDNFLAYMTKANSFRLVDWAKAMHRKGDYSGAFRLSQRALVDQEEGPNGPALLFILGRCAHFLGYYKEALEAFDKLITRHGGYGDLPEVKFRKGLVLIRLKEWSRAEQWYSELINDGHDIKSYELPLRYWLIRLKQKRGESVTQDLESIEKKFLLSYMGLRLQSEKNSGAVELPKPRAQDLKGSIWLSQIEKKSLDRAMLLASVGWFNEAQSELSSIYIPTHPEGKILVAQYFAEAFAYPIAIRLTTDALDADSTLRSLDVIKLVYPRPFVEAVESEARANQLSPYLIWGLMRQESAFSLRAQSGSQAQGLMQLIPPTAQEVASELKLRNFSPADVFDPATNIKMGSYYVTKMFRTYGGNIPLALAAYNAGPHRLKKFLESRPELKKYSELSNADIWSELWVDELPWLETNLYVKSILRNALIYKGLAESKIEFSATPWSSFLMK